MLAGRCVADVLHVLEKKSYGEATAMEGCIGYLLNMLTDRRRRTGWGTSEAVAIVKWLVRT